MTAPAAADWYKDPFCRHEYRYWDGSDWTHHVSTMGFQSWDAPVAGQALPSATPESLKLVNRELRKARIVAGEWSGGGTLLTEPVLVVSRLARYKAVYIVYNQHGQQLGRLLEPAQTLRDRVAQRGKHRYLIVGNDGAIFLTLEAPLALFRTKLIVLDAGGTEVGQIVERRGILDVGLGLLAAGEKVGAIYGERFDFHPQDAEGRDLGRIARFTRSLNHVVQIQPSIPEPLRTLVVAAALVMDVHARDLQERERAAKKASRGGGGDDGGWGWDDGGGSDGS